MLWQTNARKPLDADDHFESTLPGSKGQSLPVTFVVVMA